jgi:hypothetical protein
MGDDRDWSSSDGLLDRLCGRLLGELDHILAAYVADPFIESTVLPVVGGGSCLTCENWRFEEIHERAPAHVESS